jgi:hypothetical protein
MPEAELPVSPADAQRTLIARENGEVYDAKAQTVEAPPAEGATPATPASGEPAQNAPETTPANSEAQGEAPTPVEGGGDAGNQPEADTEPADGEPAQQQPGRNHVARKIDKLTRENAQLQRQMQELMSRQQMPPQRPQVPQPPSDPKPDPAKYTDVATFIADTSAWTARQEAQRSVVQVFGQLAQQAQQQQIVQQAAQQVHEFNERVTKGSEAIKDFAQVTTANADVEVAPHVAASIMQGVENPAVVLYHLAKNPGEVAKLNAMPAAKVAVRLGAIEANAKRPPAISNAPTPGKPVQAKAGVPTGYSDDMTPEQYMVWRKGQK